MNTNPDERKPVEHKADCLALDPFAHLLNMGCTCGAEPRQLSDSEQLAEAMGKHAREVSEWLNMVRGPRPTLADFGYPEETEE
jgi:hypothetical protein